MSAQIASALSLAMLLIGAMPALAAQNQAARVKAFTKLPDWSGLWEPDNGWITTGAGQQPPPPGDSENARKFAAAAVAEHPPLNARLESQYEAAMNAPARFVSSKDTCEVTLPELMWELGMFELLVTPEETTLIHTKHLVRHIYTDGRSHPAKEDLWPTLMGDSVGRWEGHTLVIDTVATKREIPLFGGDPDGGFKMVVLPLSDQIRISERLRRVSEKVLEDQVTVDDPVSFTHPWKLTVKYKLATDTTRLIDDDCVENDRNPVVDGKFTTVAR
jgi:hypothetical protein